MKKSDKLFLMGLVMVLLATAEVRIDGIVGALLQVLWTVVCTLIAWVLIKKSDLEEKNHERK